MKKVLATSVLSFIFSLVFVDTYSAPKNAHHIANKPLKLGVEVLFEKHLDLIRGKRIGLITNPTGINQHLESTISLFQKHADINLVALYAPEHGIRGDAQAGEYVSYYFDDYYQLPVYSLYGESNSSVKNSRKYLDKQMRTFDTQSRDKKPDPKILKLIDVMVFDMQDVGTRVYTYISTMAYAMQACADAGIPFIVLDRPNPIGGMIMEGPVLQYPKYSSFIGLYPIPLRHGMTIGELALLFNEKFLANKVKLTVIPMENWQRTQWFDQTVLPWLRPSPNLPTLNSATVYPGQVMLEGTNISEGRGTTQPFEIFGAPWIDAFKLTKKLNDLQLPGVIFHETWFTPTFSKFQNQLCSGSQLFISNRDKFRPILTTLAILSTIQELYGKQLKFHADYFDKVMGTSQVRVALEHGESLQNILSKMQPELDEFASLRTPYLLYP